MSFTVRSCILSPLRVHCVSRRPSSPLDRILIFDHKQSRRRQPIMGAREHIRTYPRAAAAIAGLIVAVSAWYLFSQMPGQDRSLRPPEEIFVTTDEGKTYFASPANRLPPFSHEGRTAHRAYVFTCDGSKTT